MAKIYTKTGDSGLTSMPDGSRASKASAAVEWLGGLDELQARLCMARAKAPQASEILLEIEADLQKMPASQTVIDVRKLEEHIDRMSEQLSELKEFFYPETEAACLLNLARTAARKAERACWAAFGDDGGGRGIYLNRLSDLLFVMERFISRP